MPTMAGYFSAMAHYQQGDREAAKGTEPGTGEDPGAPGREGRCHAKPTDGFGKCPEGGWDALCPGNPAGGQGEGRERPAGREHRSYRGNADLVSKPFKFSVVRLAFYIEHPGKAESAAEGSGDPRAGAAFDPGRGWERENEGADASGSLSDRGQESTAQPNPGRDLHEQSRRGDAHESPEDAGEGGRRPLAGDLPLHLRAHPEAGGEEAGLCAELCDL